MNEQAKPKPVEKRDEARRGLARLVLCPITGQSRGSSATSTRSNMSACPTSSAPAPGTGPWSPCPAPITTARTAIAIFSKTTTPRCPPVKGGHFRFGFAHGSSNDVLSREAMLETLLFGHCQIGNDTPINAAYPFFNSE